MNLNFLEKINSRVMASVYPTPHTIVYAPKGTKRIWISSGRVPLHDILNEKRYLNLTTLKNKL